MKTDYQAFKVLSTTNIQSYVHQTHDYQWIATKTNKLLALKQNRQILLISSLYHC